MIEIMEIKINKTIVKIKCFKHKLIFNKITNKFKVLVQTI